MEALERIVFLDTETTGLDARLGHRIIEIAAVEAYGRDLTGKSLHYYIDPEREIDPGATAVHGFTWDDLRGKPKFSAIAHEVMTFLTDAKVVIHNAPFDVAFLDQELVRLRQSTIAKRQLNVVDSLVMAKEKYPGKRNSLDSLCDRLGVDNSHRNLHGALLDARLLAEVYFAMTRGQGVLEISPEVSQHASTTADSSSALPMPPIARIAVTDDSEATHAAYVAALAKQSGVQRAWN
jgi:DNA polymerase III subunit epsilon